jgi:hypothetical protein
MPDLPDVPDREPSVVVHHAGSPTEAMVIRGLLESAGIRLPDSTGGDPFPVNEPHSGTAGVDIEVLQSQADEARRIIADYLASGEGIILDTSDEDSTGSGGDPPGE